MENILFTIKEKLPTLPVSEQKIAACILAAPQEVLNLSAAELAEKADSSAAAVIRLCHSLGVKGFIHLKVQLSAMSKEFHLEKKTDILPAESLSSLKQKLFTDAVFNFEKTNQVLQEAEVKKVSAAIEVAPVIFLYGIGASALVCADLQQKFSRLGKMVVCTSDQHDLATMMAVAPASALYWGISNSGETKEGLHLMKLAQKLGMTTVSLTKNTANSLRQLAAIPLCVAQAQEVPLRSGATTTLLNLLYAVDILFYYYLAQHYEPSLAGLEQSKEAIAQLVQLQKEN